jgi:hypothetical protein
MSQSAVCVAEAAAKYVVQHETMAQWAFVADSPREHANESLSELTGITGFFPDQETFEAFQQTILSPGQQVGARKARQWGDFQTPRDLAARVCRYLVQQGVSPRVIVEPTCGEGNFVLAALEAFPATELVYGVEIQEQYVWQLKMALLARGFRESACSTRVQICQDDVFTHCFADEVLRAENILIIGNPPWVTSAELGGLEADNVPGKRNLKSLNGLDALTGKSNFDIAEFILWRLLELFSERRGTLAMLCKNAVIKNIIETLPRHPANVAQMRALTIDAGREFGAAVDASLLVLNLGASKSSRSCQIASLDEPGDVVRTFGWTGDKFVADIAGYQTVAELDGISPWVWRQGMKHDCAAVMELKALENTLVNGEGEDVSVEADRVYSLLKGSDLRRFQASQPRKRVIITQRSLEEDPGRLQFEAPKLWAYLENHSSELARRKSSIYRNRPRFSIFGIGDYAFKPFKVAISGLHKKAQFALVPALDGRPLMLDDTCYFLGFDTYLDALWTASLLNSGPVLRFLESIVFTDAKRPYTKDILMRIDLLRASSMVSFREISDLWGSQGFIPQVMGLESDYESYRQRLVAVGQMQSSKQLSLGF